MSKTSFEQERKTLYKASQKKVTYLTVPSQKYLTINGQGAPEKSKEFTSYFQALYGIAYTLKFSLKYKTIARPKGYFDYPMPALSGLWWMEGGGKFDEKKKTKWRWTLMLMQPSFVTEALIKKTIAVLKEKGKHVPAQSKVKLKTLREGKSAQMMHVGSYKSVGKTVVKLEKAIAEDGYKFTGKHHEIYRSDPRRTPVSKLKTIVRRSIVKK